MVEFLATSRHTVEIETFDIDHWVSDIVFLFSFFEESSIIDDSHFFELVYIFCGEFFLWEGILVLYIASPLLVWEIESRLFILISSIDKSHLLLALRELTSGGLFFDDARFESVGIGHSFWKMERGNGFEPSHPRVEALVHSLFYVTPAWGRWLSWIFSDSREE